MVRRIYFDYASASPVDPRVLEAMAESYSTRFGNPSSIHRFGVEAAESVKKARESVAGLINAGDPEEIIFTSGATEANNLALLGFPSRNRDKGRRIITSSIEHISIINLCKHLQKLDYEVVHLPVDHEGLVDTESLKKEITEDTILVSIMYANGEIGTIQPIREIGKITREKRVVLHVDATAACGKIPVNVQDENIDMLTLSSNDMYGPRGVGALYVRRGVRIAPLILGGGQERGIRSGSEDVPGIVGLGKAAEIAAEEMADEGNRLQTLRDKLTSTILSEIEDSHLNGHPTKRLPNNANFRFDYIEGEALLLSLEMVGVAASSSSACTSKTLQPSHVLIAIGVPPAEAQGSLLFTLGKQNAEEDVDYVLNELPGIIRRLREMSPLTPKGET